MSGESPADQIRDAYHILQQLGDIHDHLHHLWRTSHQLLRFSVRVEDRARWGGRWTAWPDLVLAPEQLDEAGQAIAAAATGTDRPYLHSLVAWLRGGLAAATALQTGDRPSRFTVLAAANDDPDLPLTLLHDEIKAIAPKLVAGVARGSAIMHFHPLTLDSFKRMQDEPELDLNHMSLVDAAMTGLAIVTDAADRLGMLAGALTAAVRVRWSDLDGEQN